MSIQLLTMTPAYTVSKQTQPQSTQKTVQQYSLQNTAQKPAVQKSSLQTQALANEKEASEQKIQRNIYGNQVQQDIFGNKIEKDSFGNIIERDAFGNIIERDAFGNEIPSTALQQQEQKAEEAEQNQKEEAANDKKEKDNFGNEKCETCAKRKYQDGSNDPSVSFKTPTVITPERAAAAVRNHEMEHVFNERARAKKEGLEVVSQTVSYSTGICPECHRIYISGGQTRTVTRPRQEDLQIGLEKENTKGKYFDEVA